MFESVEPILFSSSFESFDFKPELLRLFESKFWFLLLVPATDNVLDRVNNSPFMAKDTACAVLRASKAAVMAGPEIYEKKKTKHL